MADNSPEGAPAEPQGTTEQHSEPTPEPQGTDTGTDWQREARKWEQRANKDRQQLAALKDQVKTLVSPDQVASTTEELATVRQQLAAEQQRALRLQVALAEGLPPDLAARLQGDTEEAMVKDAKTLKGLLKPSKGTPDAAAGTQPDNDSQPKLSADQALRAALGL